MIAIRPCRCPKPSAIAPYDGVRNYLHWLAEASRDDLRNQHFVGADGTSIAPPTALLYLLLRHAYLTALERSTLLTAGTYGGAFFDVVARDPLIANIGSEQNVLRRDYLEVDASRLGLASRSMPLADWVLSAARSDAAIKPTPVQYAADAQAAITALADLPTARLERLMAEHVDLCSYRIDAWITALYAQRLASLRGDRAAQGLYLGAFGWLENVRPATATRQRVSADSLPPVLRSDAGTDVFEDAANGGYIHAPSLPQAATAAVLRNGYLSHADSTAPQTFAINLSSARTRAAVALMQGVRSGQSIAALLGYQLERGLHEGHPGVELDQYIAVLRDRFPLVSGRLTDLSPGVSIDVGRGAQRRRWARTGRSDRRRLPLRDRRSSRDRNGRGCGHRRGNRPRPRCARCGFRSAAGGERAPGGRRAISIAPSLRCRR